MNQPWIYMCSPSRAPLPLPSPSHPSGSSQCTSPEHPSHATFFFKKSFSIVRKRQIHHNNSIMIIFLSHHTTHMFHTHSTLSKMPFVLYERSGVLFLGTTDIWDWIILCCPMNYKMFTMGGGIGMGNTCKSMADSCQCMAKTTIIV